MNKFFNLPTTLGAIAILTVGMITGVAIQQAYSSKGDFISREDLDRYSEKMALEFDTKLKHNMVKIVHEKPRFSTDSMEHYISMDKKIEHIMQKSNPKLSDGKRHQIKTYIMQYSKMYDLSPLFVAAIICRETDFRDNQVSTTGCLGLMQVSPKHHTEKLAKLGIKPEDLQNNKYGIQVGCMVLKEYLDKAKGNYRDALAYYSGSKTKPDFANKYVNYVFKKILDAHKAVEA